MELKDIDIEKISLIEEDWKITPTKVGQQIMKMVDGEMVNLGRGFVFEIKVSKKWIIVSSGKGFVETIQKGLGKLHNNGYINVKESLPPELSEDKK